MRRLKKGIRSERCLVRRFRCCVNIIGCTYPNLVSKKKIKVALRGLSTPRPLRSIVFLPQQVPAFISRGATHQTDARDLYQRRRELLPILLADPEFTKSDRIFYMPQSLDMGHIILLPLRRKAYWGFSGCPKNPSALNPRTREHNGKYYNIKVLYYIMLHYNNLMGPLLYIQSVLDRNLVVCAWLYMYK
jgi:hypothetical protein